MQQLCVTHCVVHVVTLGSFVGVKSKAQGWEDSVNQIKDIPHAWLRLHISGVIAHSWVGGESKVIITTAKSYMACTNTCNYMHTTIKLQNNGRLLEGIGVHHELLVPLPLLLRH